MKLIRVPWIRCRADEFGAVLWKTEMNGLEVAVLAYSEAEAKGWWKNLTEAERKELLGIGDTESPYEIGLL